MPTQRRTYPSFQDKEKTRRDVAFETEIQPFLAARFKSLDSLPFLLDIDLLQFRVPEVIMPSELTPNRLESSWYQTRHIDDGTAFQLLDRCH